MGIEETATHRKGIVVCAVDATGHHRRGLHAAKATAIGQALRDGKAVVIEVKETGRACRRRRLQQLLAQGGGALKRTAAVAIWYERQLSIEILLLQLLRAVDVVVVRLEWIHHIVEQLLLALKGIDVVVVVR